MTAKRGSRMVAKIGAAVAIAAGLGLASPAMASAAPAVSASPSSGLSATQTITVTGSGLPADDTFHVGQCSAISATEFACDYSTSVDVDSDASGALSTPLTVNREFTATAADGSSVTVDCTTADCVVGAFNDAFEGGTAPLSFSG